jgi:hypothetical protein
MTAEILNLIPLFKKIGHQKLLEGESGVVCTQKNGLSHDILPI